MLRIKNAYFITFSAILTLVFIVTIKFFSYGNRKYKENSLRKSIFYNTSDNLEYLSSEKSSDFTVF